ncbi:MAG TPA: amidohydrolase family protein [Kofleriaceae bacterium]|nr:amidohydrolase family protein [Kofleriaceae bacterium]
MIRARDTAAAALPRRAWARGTGATVALAVLALLAGSAAAQAIVITGATVYQRGGAKLENASVLVQGGKIAEIGASVVAPVGAKQIDGRGKVVAPGFVEAFSQLGLIEIELEASAVDGRFAPTPVDIHAAYRAVDAYNARSVGITVARTGGITSAMTGPVGGLVAGQAAFVSLGDAAAGPLQSPSAMVAALGPRAIASGSRGHAAERLRELLDDADVYRKNRGAFDRNQSRRLIANRLDLEALIPVLEGRLPLVVTADAEVDIRSVLAIAAERRLRVAIASGVEAWRVAKQLAAAKVPVILDPTANLPTDLGALDVRDDGAAILARAGVPVAISTLGDVQQARTLRQLAGIAVASGLPWDKALDAITSVPAQLFGLRDRGALERGAAADLVVWSGDPLELASRPEVVIIGGVVQSLETHQTRLRDRYRTLPKR